MTSFFLQRTRCRGLDVDPAEIQTHREYDPERFTGFMFLSIKTPKDCYLHPGTGCLQAKLPDGKTLEIAAAAATSNGKPTFPGTSLKGALRSVVEYLTGSCDPFTGVKERDPSRRPLIKCKAPKSLSQYGNPSNKLCVACHLFGTTGYAGRVSFADATFDEKGLQSKIIKVKVGYPVKTGSNFKVYDLHGCGQDNKLDWAEENRVVYSGRFWARLDVTNLESHEIGLILAALGTGISPLKKGFRFRLGGGKYAGLGAAIVKVGSFQRFYPDENYATDTLMPFLRPHVAAAAEHYAKFGNGLEDKLNQLVKVWPKGGVHV